jgi:hypothetical protein
MRRFAMIAPVLCLLVQAAAADPVGQYSLQGTNPGNGTAYRGTVTVEQTGETYKVTWVVGGERYVGTGIGDKNFLAVSYTAGKYTGLALYGADGPGWAGVWTYANGTKIGSEKWVPK